MSFRILTEEDKAALIGEPTHRELGELFEALQELSAEISLLPDSRTRISTREFFNPRVEVTIVGGTFAATAKAMLAIREIVVAIQESGPTSVKVIDQGEP